VCHECVSDFSCCTTTAIVGRVQRTCSMRGYPVTRSKIPSSVWRDEEHEMQPDHESTAFSLNLRFLALIFLPISPAEFQPLSIQRHSGDVDLPPSVFGSFVRWCSWSGGRPVTHVSGCTCSRPLIEVPAASFSAAPPCSADQPQTRPRGRLHPGTPGHDLGLRRLFPTTRTRGRIHPPRHTASRSLSV